MDRTGHTRRGRMPLGRAEMSPSPTTDMGHEDSQESGTEEPTDTLSNRHMCGRAEETGRRANRQSAQARRQLDLWQTVRHFCLPG